MSALVDLSAASTWGVGGAWLHVEIFACPALTDLAGLAGLFADNGADPLTIHLQGLTGLTSLAGLEAVVAGNLWFTDLPELQDLAALESFTTGKSVHLIDLPKVTSLAGLATLESADWLMLGDCVNMGSGGMNGLQSLAGLEGLKSVGSLALANNMNLASLDGAPLLTTASDGVNAVNNPMLSKAAFDAFLGQFAPTPTHCHGGWDECPCFEILPW